VIGDPPIRLLGVLDRLQDGGSEVEGGEEVNIESNNIHSKDLKTGLLAYLIKKSTKQWFSMKFC
jgi:hypothetical protein